MRKSILVVVVLVGTALMAYGQSEQTLPWFGTHYQPGNTSFSLEGGVDFGTAVSLAAVPSAELIVTKFRPFDLFSIDVGLAARGIAAFRFAEAGTTITVGGAPLAMFHAGVRELEGSYGTVLNMIDFYTGFGLGYLVALGAGGGGSLAWANANGVNIFLSDSLALRVGTSYFSPFSGGLGAFSTNVGVTFKVGPAEEIGESLTFAVPDLEGMSGEVMYATFSSFYALAAISGGYLPSDDTFEVGDGTVIRQVFVDGNDQQTILLFRALLHDGAESEWWRYEFEVDEEAFAFEAEIDADGEILMIRYEDQATGDVVLYEPADPSRFQTFRDLETIRSEEEMESLIVGQERISVEAGSFQTDRVEATEEGSSFTWWLSGDVPGRVVQFEGESADGEAFFGELIEVVRGYASPWGAAW